MNKIITVAMGILTCSSVAAALSPSAAEFGGHCAYGLSQGKQVMTDCSVTWQDPASQKNYCFLNEANKAEWAKSIPVNMATANAEYARVAGRASVTKSVNNALGEATTKVGNAASDATNKAGDAVSEATK